MAWPLMTKKQSKKNKKYIDEADYRNCKFKWGPRKSPAVGAKQTVFKKQAIASLSISELIVPEQMFAPDLIAISEHKLAISIGGQSAIVTVRRHDSGKLEQLDGFHVTTALKELGEASVTAIVISGLSDQEAEFRRLSGYLGPNLRKLDRAIVIARMLELESRAVKQSATPAGGRQPRDRGLRKAAKKLGLSKEAFGRSEKIARIVPAVQQRIRDLKIDDDQSRLLEIAKAGDTEELQGAALRAIIEGQTGQTKREHSRIDPKDAGASKATDPDRSVPRGSIPVLTDMPDIPPCLRRGIAVGFEDVENEWAQSQLKQLLLAVSPDQRRRFIDECLLPALFPTGSERRAAASV